MGVKMAAKIRGDLRRRGGGGDARPLWGQGPSPPCPPRALPCPRLPAPPRAPRGVLARAKPRLSRDDA